MKLWLNHRGDYYSAEITGDGFGYWGEVYGTHMGTQVRDTQDGPVVGAFDMAISVAERDIEWHIQMGRIPSKEAALEAAQAAHDVIIRHVAAAEQQKEIEKRRNLPA